MEREDSILPGQELDRLRREIDMLKRKQGSIESSDVTERDAMYSLSKSITSLMKVFKEASEDLKMDTHDAVLVTQKLDRIIERLEKVEVQNEKIAKGVVAVADMIEDMQAQGSPRRAIGQARMGAAQPPSPTPMMPGMMQAEPRPLPTYNMPPDEKKKGFSLKF